MDLFLMSSTGFMSAIFMLAGYFFCLYMSNNLGNNTITYWLLVVVYIILGCTVGIVRDAHIEDKVIEEITERAIEKDEVWYTTKGELVFGGNLNYIINQKTE